jgi:DMSO/TMAO reductase YedYZ molybdopterin-dependent catalytic subunit
MSDERDDVPVPAPDTPAGEESVEVGGEGAAPSLEPMPPAGDTAAGNAPQAGEPAGEPAAESVAESPAPVRPPPPPPARRGFLAERPEVTIEFPRGVLAMQTRRDFLLLTIGAAVTAAGAWWLLPDGTKARLAGMAGRENLDTLAARVGLSRVNRERALDRALTFDDDVAEALYSKDRRVRTYSRSDVTPLRNNYHGRTPGPEYLPSWTLNLSGLASGAAERLTIEQLLSRFVHHEQVTRLICVEGWSAVAWWGGIRFADLLTAFPPAPGARWAAMRSAVSLDSRGNVEPYYVSIDLETARHPQALLATHQDGQPLTVAHGAPMRLLVPMKLGLKNIKALTDIAYTAEEPPDYWAEVGYSKYDGL